MKKILAIVLAMVMLLSVMPTISFMAEESEYIFMDVNWGYEVNITDEEPVLYYAYQVEKSGYYSFYSFCSDDDTYVHCYDENHNELGFDDNSGFEKNFAYNRYLEEGKTYYFEIGANIKEDNKVRFGIEIRDISSSIQDMVLNEEYRVQPDVDYDREYFSFTPDSDGYYAFMVGGGGGLMDIDAVMYDSEWNYLSEDDRSGHAGCFYLPYYLEAGKTYYYTALSDYYMMKDAYYVRIQESTPILDINVVSNPDKMTYYTGYVENTVDFSGLELELTDSKGKVYNYNYDEDTYVSHTAVYVEMCKDENGKYYISIDAGLAHEELDVNVIDCPIESISVYSATTLTLYENMSGNYTKTREGEEYFDYSYKLPKDLMMQINYTDGTSVVTSYAEPYDGMKFTYEDTQHFDHWELGANSIRIQYYDVECDFYVNVVESPIDYFTVEKVPTRQYIYYVNGGNSTEGNFYEFYPDLEGIEFTGHYKDGTTKLFTYKDLDPYYSYIQGNWSYKIENHKVYGPGKTTISFIYCNREISYEAIVLGTGDCDADGSVSVMDATKIQKYLVSDAKMTSAEKKVSDYDVDGEVTILDATEIQKWVAGFDV